MQALVLPRMLGSMLQRHPWAVCDMASDGTGRSGNYQNSKRSDALSNDRGPWESCSSVRHESEDCTV